MSYGIKKLTIEFSSNRLTHFGGVYLFSLFLKRIGLRKFLTLNIRYEQRNNHYTFSEMIFSLIYPIVLGLGRIEITNLLGNNGIFKSLTGLKSFPKPTTLRRFLLRSSKDLLPQLLSLHNRLREYFLSLIVPDKKLIFDLDSSILTVFGKQEGAEKGYNPKHRGKKSYHPLFCFEEKSGQSLFGYLRKGNVYTSLGAYQSLKEILEKYSLGNYTLRSRGDAGFYDKKIIALLSQNLVEFVIVADLTSPLKYKLSGLKFKPINEIYSFSELYYQPVNWPKGYRFCIIRKKLPKEELAQTTLFVTDRFAYSAIITNLSMTSRNVWKFYNGRAQCERNIRGLKEDYYLSNIPTKHFVANELYLEVLLLTYDLVKWFQKLCLPEQWQSKTLQTLRHELLLLPSSFVRHGSKQILRFPKNSPQQKIFWHARNRILRLKNLNDLL
ncbi:MAG: IS1380 family transposase [Patescibacteria group bacterium]